MISGRYILYLYVLVLLIYAWRDWFVSLCGLILMTAVMEFPNVPKTMYGIQGLNLWNILLLGTFIAWLAARRRRGLTWDLPRHMNILLLLYLGVILIGFLRCVIDRSYLGDREISGMVSEELINTIKWVIPGLMLFDGCRSRKRLRMAIVCILAVYLIIATQIVRHMPASSVLGAGLSQNKRLYLIKKWSGYSACDASAMLSGASWAVLAAIPILRRRRWRLLALPLVVLILGAQAATGGRAGYLAWGVTGLVLCLVKWRRYLILAPAVPVILFFAFPGATKRALWGTSEQTATGEFVSNADRITSGRVIIWPAVIDKIEDSPVIGHGRLAMKRTGLQHQLGVKFDEPFPHPHNMYLELLLDNGILGAIPVLAFFGIVIYQSARMFLHKTNRLCSAAGGVALSLVVAQLVAGIGAQHYYPRESTVGMWLAMFMVFRVAVEYSKSHQGAAAAARSWPQPVTVAHLGTA